MTGWERMLAEQREEIERLRSEVSTFGILWATQYARDNGYPDRCLHPTHYDILARAGARMDAFTRYVPPESPAPPDDPDPTGQREEIERKTERIALLERELANTQAKAAVPIPDFPTAPSLSDNEREGAIRRIFGWRTEFEYDEKFLLRLLDAARLPAPPDDPDPTGTER